MAAPAATPSRSPLGAYVTVVAVAGCALYAFCVARLAARHLPIEWWIFAGLTFISGRITLKVPSLDASFTVSEVFAFTSVLLFGPEAGAVTLALDSLVLAWHRRFKLQQACFNFGNLTLAVWLSRTLFFKVSGAQPVFGHGGPSATLILPLALFATTHFVVNTGLIAIPIGLQTDTSPVTSGAGTSCGCHPDTRRAHRSRSCSSQRWRKFTSRRSRFSRRSCSSSITRCDRHSDGWRTRKVISKN
jgi:hypothetical protein